MFPRTVYTSRRSTTTRKPKATDTIYDYMGSLAQAKKVTVHRT